MLILGERKRRRLDATEKDDEEPSDEDVSLVSCLHLCAPPFPLYLLSIHCGVSRRVNRRGAGGVWGKGYMDGKKILIIRTRRPNPRLDPTKNKGISTTKMKKKITRITTRITLIMGKETMMMMVEKAGVGPTTRGTERVGAEARGLSAVWRYLTVEIVLSKPTTALESAEIYAEISYLLATCERYNDNLNPAAPDDSPSPRMA